MRIVDLSIVENLANLGAIAGLEARISVLPLHIPGCDGAPTPAAAFVED